MDVDGIAGEVFDERELQEAVGIVINNENEVYVNDAVEANDKDEADPSQEDCSPTTPPSPIENDVDEEELLDVEEPENPEHNHEPTEMKAEIFDAEDIDESDCVGQNPSSDATEIRPDSDETSHTVQVRSLEELCDSEEVGDLNGTDQTNTEPQGDNAKNANEEVPEPLQPCRTSERKRKAKKLSDLSYDSEDAEDALSSEDEWNPEENDVDPDYEERRRKRRRVSVSKIKRARRTLKSPCGRFISAFRDLEPVKLKPRPSPAPVILKPRPTPPPLQPIEGKTPLVVIKPLQIPESLIQRTKSFVIKQEGHAQIQVVPKFRAQTSGSKLKSSSQSPSPNLQHCANCNAQFSKLMPKVSHFRLNGERLSASDAFKKIFQLQLQKHKRVPDFKTNERVGLCSPCSQLIAKIYGAVHDFTQKRSRRSYFHQVSVTALRDTGSNGSFSDVKPFALRRNVMTNTDRPSTCDKGTNYPTDPAPYQPAIPVMPEKVDDYSRVTALCDICGKGLTKESGLKTHLLLTHSISQEEKSRDFVCGVCGKAYFFQYLLKNHMAVHSDDKPFSCPKENCTATFKSRASLRTHRIEVHELREQGQTFGCQFCDKKYLRPRDLRDHVVARHSEIPQFECPHCHKFFQRKKNIKTHKCPDRPAVDATKREAQVLQDIAKSENHQSLMPIDSHEDLLLVKNPSSKLTASELGISSEIVQALEIIHEDYDQPPEAVQHIEIHEDVLRPIHYIPHLPQQETVDVGQNTFRSQGQHQQHEHIVTPGTTVQYIQPINFSPHEQQQYTTQATGDHQIHSYRIHSIGSHPNLDGEALGVYETVNFLDILNDTRQQPVTTAGTFQTLTFTK